MELKVWVENIQRIVCGVTEHTTCQDVVYALAHATGKTGRFTLMERWRNSERLLAPQENPMKVLMKWGEYASDVQFILQRTALEARPVEKASNNYSIENAGLPWNLKNQVPNVDEYHKSCYTPGMQEANMSDKNFSLSQNRDIKKSLTFSGIHFQDNYDNQRIFTDKVGMHVNYGKFSVPSSTPFYNDSKPIPYPHNRPFAPPPYELVRGNPPPPPLQSMKKSQSFPHSACATPMPQLYNKNGSSSTLQNCPLVSNYNSTSNHVHASSLRPVRELPPYRPPPPPPRPSHPALCKLNKSYSESPSPDSQSYSASPGSAASGYSLHGLRSTLPNFSISHMSKTFNSNTKTSSMSAQVTSDSCNKASNVESQMFQNTGYSQKSFSTHSNSNTFQNENSCNLISLANNPCHSQSKESFQTEIHKSLVNSSKICPTSVVSMGTKSACVCDNSDLETMQLDKNETCHINSKSSHFLAGHRDENFSNQINVKNISFDNLESSAKMSKTGYNVRRYEKSSLNNNTNKVSNKSSRNNFDKSTEINNLKAMEDFKTSQNIEKTSFYLISKKNPSSIANTKKSTKEFNLTDSPKKVREETKISQSKLLESRDSLHSEKSLNNPFTNPEAISKPSDVSVHSTLCSNDTCAHFDDMNNEAKAVSNSQSSSNSHIEKVSDLNHSISSSPLTYQSVYSTPAGSSQRYQQATKIKSISNTKDKSEQNKLLATPDINCCNISLDKSKDMRINNQEKVLEQRQTQTNTSEASVNYSTSNEKTSTSNENTSASNVNNSSSNETIVTSSKYNELLKLVNNQKLKLEEQKIELTRYEAETSFLESKFIEDERKLNYLKGEIQKYETTSQDYEVQMEALESELKDSKTIESETNGEIDEIKPKLQQAEEKISHINKRISFIKSEIEAFIQAEDEKSNEIKVREEEAIKREISKLKEALEQSTNNSEKTEKLEDDFLEEVSKIEEEIDAKRNDLEALKQELCEANLEALSNNDDSKAFEARGGSMKGTNRRMIGSPRRLENAAPTAKNPHGVWV